jgi:hypothetical protein
MASRGLTERPVCDKSNENETETCRLPSMETMQVASIGHDGTIYVFPAWEDGSIQIMAATGSGSAVRVILIEKERKDWARF